MQTPQSDQNHDTTFDSHQQDLVETLRASEELFRTAFQYSPVGMCITAPDGRLQNVNQMLVDMLGFTKAELEEKHFNDITHPEDLEIGKDVVGRMISGAAPSVSFEKRYLRKTGEVVWTQVNSTLLRDSSGKPLHFITQILDITERRQVEEQLREGEEKYRAFFLNSMDAILLTSPDGSIQAANPAACKMLGRTEAEICALGRSGLIDMNDPRLGPLLEERARTGKAFGELTMFRQDGSPFPVEMSSALFQDGQGNTRTTMIIRDITERKNTENQIIQMKRLYATLSQVNQTIVRVKDHAELYRSICDVAVQFGEFSLAWIGLLDEATGDVRPVAANGLDLNQWPFPIVNIQEGVLKDSLSATAIRTSRVMTSEDILADDRLQNLHGLFQKYEYHSAATIPFGLRGKTIGMVSLASNQIGLFKAKEEVLLLEEIGLDISFALETMETEAERRQAEESLREREYLLSASQRAAHVGTWSWKVGDTKVYWSDETYRIYGLSPHMVSPDFEFFFEIVHPEDRLKLREWATAIAAGSHPPPVEFRALRFDGSFRMIRTEGDVIETVDGVPSHIAGTAYDITERKQAEEKLQRQNQRLKALREIDTAILAADTVEDIVGAALSHIRELIECRRAAVALFDWEMNEALMFDVKAIGASSIPKGMRVPLAPFQDLIQGLSKNQTVVLNDLTALPDPPPQFQAQIRDGIRSLCFLSLFSQSNLIGSFSMASEVPGFFDEEKLNLGREVANQVAIAITQNNLLNDLRDLNADLEQRVAGRTEELHLMNIELQNAIRARDEFLAGMSHELRTPLNAIIGFTGTLLMKLPGPLNADQDKQLTTIQTSARHLLSLINDLLDLARIASGKVELKLEPVVCQGVIEEVVTSLRPLVDAKGLQFTVESPKGEIILQTDRRALHQIILNLSNNAIKFTEHGEISLELAKRSENGRSVVEISVADTGIGIRAEDQVKLFEAFEQVGSSGSRRLEGTGLGLHLSQKLAVLLGGQITFVSEYGKGTTFTLEIPEPRKADTQ